MCSDSITRCYKIYNCTHCSVYSRIINSTIFTQILIFLIHFNKKIFTILFIKKCFHPKNTVFQEKQFLKQIPLKGRERKREEGDHSKVSFGIFYYNISARETNQFVLGMLSTIKLNNAIDVSNDYIRAEASWYVEHYLLSTERLKRSSLQGRANQNLHVDFNLQITATLMLTKRALKIKGGSRAFRASRSH